MNSYVTLDSKKYVVTKQSTPVLNKPANVRALLNGNVDVTYGPATTKEWQFVLKVPVSPASGYASLSDFETTFAKLTELVFTDHYGTSHYVHLLGPAKENSLMNVWDATSNVFYIPVRIVRSRSYP